MATRVKTGGRVKGTPNKATSAKQPEAAVSPDPSQTPVSRARTRVPPVREVEKIENQPVPQGPPGFPRYKLARVDQLVPYANNARTHTPAQVEKIAASIKHFGFTNPVLTDGHLGIVAGHGRVLAAELLGMDVVPTIALAHLTDDQRRAYIIADNKLALDAGWDEDMLRLELGELQVAGFDLDLTGFAGIELDALFADRESGNSDPDETPPVEARKVSRPGDVWLLGKHRLVCGDSTDADVVARALNGAEPTLMVTDPPYGVKYDAKWRVAAGINGPNAAHGKVTNDDRADWTEAWALFAGDVAYVWHGALHAAEVAVSLQSSGFTIRSQIIWAKSVLVMGRGDYHWQHEPCWYVVREGKPGHYAGDRKQTTLWQIDKPHKSETGHSTQKPVECMERPILNNSQRGDAVYEPFSGSGTTIIAAERTARAAIAIEIEPAYVDVAVRRWQQYVGGGNAAILESDGRTFAEISGEREGEC